MKRSPKRFAVGWGNAQPVRFYRQMPPGAVYFQLPGSGAFGRKDALARLLAGAAFHPASFPLPSAAAAARAFSKRHTCLYKPALAARGNGIFIVQRGSEFNTTRAAVLQRYQPSLLLGGYKFDLRIYVFVTSVDPLCVYLYSRGIARFATVKYANLAANRKEKCMFLTNYAVNKATSAAAGAGAKRPRSVVVGGGGSVGAFGVKIGSDDIFVAKTDLNGIFSTKTGANNTFCAKTASNDILGAKTG